MSTLVTGVGELVTNDPALGEWPVQHTDGVSCCG
jgi:hypothetical protein